MALSSLQIKMMRRLLESGSEEKIAHALEKIHPSDISLLFSEINEIETVVLINSLFRLSKAGLTLKELPEFMLPDILEYIDDKKMSDMLCKIESDDALHILHKVPQNRWENILSLLPGLKREKIQRLLLYPKDSAGEVMSTDFVTLREDMTVEKAIETLRSLPEIQGIFYIYIINDQKQLVGVQPLRSLIMANPSSLIKNTMLTEVRSVLVTTNKEEVAQIVAQYNLLALPVLNENNELLGVITVDDVVDIVKEEATEDIYHLAGLSEEDRAVTPLRIKVRKRLPWMILNLATAVLAASVVKMFETSIQRVVALAVCMPIVAGMGGNCAAQSLTVITRSIALGEMAFIKAYKAILKEVGNGLVMGTVTGLVAGAFSYFWMDNPYLGLVLFLAMAGNLVVGGLAGATVPILLKTFKLDPAVGSTVIVTTFTDCCGFFLFLGIAKLMMPYLSH